jgi:hypothetical protein
MALRTEPSQEIAAWLAGLWELHKSKNFHDHVRKIYGRDIDESPAFECIYVAEAESGDLLHGQIGGIIKKWWQVNDSGLVAITKLNLPARDEPVGFDRCPVLKFFTDGKRVVLGERLGPDLISRRVGRLVFHENGISIEDLRVLWTSTIQ